ncbi:MAG: bifunctional homocysteine S-methyltransferase/methylenetetrahydrofolate reductase [Anaerolineaceae bacterium]|nr:MAG: bifunctional homocysteine S-methyltransferase/methylenetetrahydrofolate reductase [Anaerolineaceae bacterium]
MDKIPFRQRLNAGTPILADGAIGTLLHQRGAAINACFDALNLTAPDIVVQIHRDYIIAGARLLETNTFGANRIRLKEYGLSGRVAEINRRAVDHAQTAITAAALDEPVYIAGAIGPLSSRLRHYGHITETDMRETFAEQIRALILAGVDALILETFTDHAEILTALHVAQDVRAELARDVPIIAQMTFAADNRTVLGHAPARVAHDLSRAGADVIGVNCGVGPSQIATVLQQMNAAVPDAGLCAMPNAGFPEAIGGRVMYPATADYFGDYAVTFKAAGAAIIGGCCGTTPEHIAAMHAALSDPLRSVPIIPMNGDDQPPEPQAPPHPTELAMRLAEGRFTVTVEVAPPRSFTLDDLVGKAHLLRAAGADLLDVADTPAARMRMSAYAVAHVLQSQVGMETVLHFPTRGRNILRVQGDLLAAHALDLRNLFVTMGDPTRIGDYPDANDGYDIVPSKLIDLITHKMNEGQDMGGNSIGRPTAFTVGCALNMFADDLDRELGVLEKKLSAGADFALGQAVFEPHKIELFLQRYEERFGHAFNLPVLMGIMPLYGLRQARFLHNEVPGISIPPEIMKRLEDAGDDAPQEGVRIAQEILKAIQGLVAGAYIIPAFGRYELAAEVIDAVTMAR